MSSNEVVENQASIDWLFEKYGKQTAKTIEMTDAGRMTIKALEDAGAIVIKTEGNRAYVQRPSGSRQSGNVLLDSGQFYCFTNSWPPFEAGGCYGPRRVKEVLQQHSINDPPNDLPKPAPKPSIEFPFQLLTGAAGYFADTFANYLETPQEFLFMSYLTCIGTILTRKLTLASEIAPQPRLYVLLLGQSADERKSTVLLKTTELFRDTISGFNSCWGVGSAEGLLKQLGKVEGGFLLCLDEFKHFISKCKIQGSVLLPCTTTLFESNRYENYTKRTSVCLEDAHLSLLAASTLETYEATWDRSFTDIGFNNRLFLVPATANRRFSFPEKLPRTEKQKIKEHIRRVLKHAYDCRELRMTEEARELYHDWYMGLERSIHAKRLDTYALRLMCLLAVNNQKSEVDAEVVSHATALCDWQLQVRKFYSPIDADNVVAKMEERIRRFLGKHGAVTERELKIGVHYTRHGLWVYNIAKENLRKAGELFYDQKTKIWWISR